MICPPEDNEKYMGDTQRLDTNQHLSKLLQIQHLDASDKKEAIEPILIKSIGYTIAQLMPGSIHSSTASVISPALYFTCNAIIL
jgi:hypothetical protein